MIRVNYFQYNILVLKHWKLFKFKFKFILFTLIQLQYNNTKENKEAKPEQSSYKCVEVIQYF